MKEKTKTTTLETSIIVRALRVWEKDLSREEGYRHMANLCSWLRKAANRLEEQDMPNDKTQTTP